MSILSRKPKLSRLTLNRAIALLVAVTFVLTGGYFFAAQAHPEHDDSEYDKREQVKKEKMEMAKLKAEKFVERRTKRVIARLNLSDEEAESLAPKVKAVIQHRMMRAKALGPMLKALKKTMVAGDDAEVQSALEEFKTKRSALETELEALETSLLEGLTPRQEVLLTLSGVVGKRGGYAVFKDWRGHGKKKFKDRDHQRGRRHDRHGHYRSKHDYDHGKSKHDHDKSKHDHDKSKHDHDRFDHDH